ncbi:MAG: helix-turn-helix domain-containing protein [Methyloprofundus sp.]|nr:helix-turn-helix domain-containing protein [Methyloprofundus sp.]
MKSQSKVIEITPRACNSKEAAKYLGVAETTLKQSRSTGTLFGIATPTYKKVGHSVIYEFSSLDKWLDALPEYKNTADEALQKY